MKIDTTIKAAWLRPELKKMTAGAAESLTGTTADGGQGAQGS